jgi:hypothetical protein
MGAARGQGEAGCSSDGSDGLIHNLVVLGSGCKDSKKSKKVKK